MGRPVSFCGTRGLDFGVDGVVSSTVPAMTAAILLVLATTIPELLSSTPADSLARILPAARPEADAQMVLGHLYFARGEYRQAATAFARAGANMDAARRPEARYRAGLCWLALGAHERARAALQEAAVEESRVRAASRLALAQSWEATGRSDRALDELQFLLNDRPGDWTAAALAMQRELALRLHRTATARQAGERLLREYPNSMEATRLRQIIDSPRTAAGSVVLRLGAFADEARARSLAADARRAGFTEVRVIPPSGMGAPLFAVQLGPYADPDEAKRRAELAEEALGVAAEHVKAP